MSILYSLKGITSHLASLMLLTVMLVVHPSLATPLLAQNQSGITAPVSGNSVGGDVVVSGTAIIEPFLRYELYYKLEPSGDDAYIYFDGGTTPVANGQLGIWRTSNLPPGTYSIRLRVVKTDGNYGEFVSSNLNLNANVEPTATATSSEPTATPIPTATFTPAPQPTAIVGQVTQPNLPGQPTPTPVTILAPTPVPQGDGDTITFEANPTVAVNSEGGSFTRQLGEAVALDRLRGYFTTGMRFSAILILAIVVLFAGKRIFIWAWMQYR